MLTMQKEEKPSTINNNIDTLSDDDDQVNDKVLRVTKSKPNFSESVYLLQKQKIAEIIANKEYLKQTSKTDRNDTTGNSGENENSTIVLFSKSDIKNFWERADFENDNFNSDDLPILKNLWKEPGVIEFTTKGLELRNQILRSKERMSLLYQGFEVNAQVTLRGESSFWMFTRSNDVFNEYTSAIKISKDDKCQKMFICLGTFVMDSMNHLVFKVFLKQQLVDTSKIKNKSYYENDECELKIDLVDSAEDKIMVKVFVNDSKSENLVTGDFFLPNYDKSRLMVAGNGQSCILKSLLSKTFNNSKIDYDGISMFSSDKRNCECCSIY